MSAMRNRYELNSQFFYKTWKEIFILCEVGFEKTFFLLDYSEELTAENLDQILSRMELHIDQFIINNKYYYIDCLLDFAKEKPFMYTFLYIIFNFKHLYDSAPKRDGDISWKNPKYKEWSLDFVNNHMALVSLQKSFLKETKGITGYPLNLSFLNQDVCKAKKFV